MTSAQGSPANLQNLVAVFLPFDPDQVDSAFDAFDEIDVIAASLGSFSVAALLVLGRLNRHQRQDFCQRITDLSEGEVQPWMAEAALRSVEGDHDALTGTDPSLMSGVHLYGLSLLSDGYLSVDECNALRPQALERAAQYRPQLAS